MKFKSVNDLMKIDGMRKVDESSYELELDNLIRFTINSVNVGPYRYHIIWLINDVEGWTSIDSIYCIDVQDVIDKITIAVAHTNKGVEDADLEVRVKVKNSRRHKKLNPPAAWKDIKLVNHRR